MSNQHGTIEFINAHTINADIDVVDEDGEYFIASLAPGASIRQYSPAGTRWIVRVSYNFATVAPQCPDSVTTSIQVLNREEQEQFKATLDRADAPASVSAAKTGKSWSVTVAYAVTTQPGPQSYEITRYGLTEPGVVKDSLSDLASMLGKPTEQEGNRNKLGSRMS